VHNGHDTDDYYRYAENGDYTLYNVSGSIKEDKEGEEDRDDYTLNSIFNESALSSDGRPSTCGLSEVFHLIRR